MSLLTDKEVDDLWRKHNDGRQLWSVHEFAREVECAVLHRLQAVANAAAQFQMAELKRALDDRRVQQVSGDAVGLPLDAWKDKHG